MCVHTYTTNIIYIYLSIKPQSQRNCCIMFYQFLRSCVSASITHSTRVLVYTIHTIRIHLLWPNPISPSAKLLLISCIDDVRDRMHIKRILSNKYCYSCVRCAIPRPTHIHTFAVVVVTTIVASTPGARSTINCVSLFASLWISILILVRCMQICIRSIQLNENSSHTKYVLRRETRRIKEPMTSFIYIFHKMTN